MAYLAIRNYTAMTTTLCLIRGTTGMPCPMCGMTRAYKALLVGNIQEAWLAHPLFWLPLLLGLIWLFKGKALIIKYLYPIIALLLVVYVVRMYLYFPNVYPMLYNQHALWPTVISFFSNIY